MPPVTKAQVDDVRRFNRLYTTRIGALDAGHLGSGFSLTEVRVLYELAHRPGLTANALSRELGVDPGYLSRILRRFQRLRLVRREKLDSDRRVAQLALTPKGREAFAPLDRKANRAVEELLGEMPAPRQAELVASMQRIRSFLDPDAARTNDEVILRDPRPGDLGWVVHRHGALYAAEYGYDARFEAIVARVVADFVDHFDATGERCWIAERGGEILGSVFLVRKSRTVAKLRLLYLEPHARGLGLGRRLVDQCISFAREAGYRKITLWTQSSLTAARHIYKATGFKLVSKKTHADFGPREAAEIWELRLNP